MIATRHGSGGRAIDDIYNHVAKPQENGGQTMWICLSRTELTEMKMRTARDETWWHGGRLPFGLLVEEPNIKWYLRATVDL